MEEEWTYWNEEFGSFFLTDDRKNSDYWDLVNKIGKLEEEINKLKAMMRGWNTN